MSLRGLLKILAILGLAACSDLSRQSSRPTILGGEPEQGKHLIHAYGCGACHTIEGVRGARGKVGPALVNFERQHLLAGFLPNTPTYLIAWLMDPVSLYPQTGMPVLGITEVEARHIASYLYSLGEPAQVYPPDPPLPLRGQGNLAPRLDDPVAERTGTTPRTHRVVPPGG